MEERQQQDESLDILLDSDDEDQRNILNDSDPPLTQSENEKHNLLVLYHH